MFMTNAPASTPIPAPAKPSDDELLNQALETPHFRKGHTQPGSSPEVGSSTQQPTEVEYRQWQIGSNDSYRPAGLTRSALPAGVYTFNMDNIGLVIRRLRVISDELLALPDTANERVLQGMTTFWQRQDLYRKHGLLYKRGILLWGPPGGGKTATLTLLSLQLQRQDGIVIVCYNPELCSYGMSQLRRIEPTRPLICIIEDIDEVIQQYGEHHLLALLDGENQVENIVNIATTNYPERLGARIVNRPSRFDERILVGMPSLAARRVYLEKVAHSLHGADLARWVNETDGLSIAHLRELAAAVLCLGQPYAEVLARLRTMRHQIRERDGMGGSASGFGLGADAGA